MGKAILIASGKGGTGRTTFAVNMAVTLAEAGSKVCLLDFNMGLRNADLYLGLQDKVIFDMGDIFSGVCKLDRALIEDDRFPGLSLLETTQGKLINGLTTYHIKALMKQLKASFDYIIVDGPAPLSKDLDLIAPSCDSAVLVVTPDYLALRNSDSEDRRLAAIGIRNRCFVINQIRPELFDEKSLPGISDINRAFTIPMAGMVPYDISIHIGNNQGRPVVSRRNSYIADNFSDIVARMLG